MSAQPRSRRAGAGVGEAEGGFTLVEMMVAMSLMLVVVATSMTVVITSQKATDTSRQVQNLNEEARQAMNRMARDLREANKLVTAVNADGPLYDPTAVTALRFQGDYNGDGCTPSPAAVTVACPNPIPYSAGNPEDVTYCFDPASRQLFVIDNQVSSVTPITTTSANCSGGLPLLAGNVSGLQIAYRSQRYSYDTSPTDGVTTWRELDAAVATFSNNNGLLDAELVEVDSLVLTVDMRDGNHSQQYRTQVDLRNLSQ